MIRDEIAEDMHVDVVLIGAQFNAADQLDVDRRSRLGGFGKARERVVIGQAEPSHAGPVRFLGQLGRAQDAVRKGAMGVQVDSSQRIHAFHGRVVPSIRYRGSMTRRIAVRSSLSIVTSMNSGRQTTSM